MSTDTTPQQPADLDMEAVVDQLGEQDIHAFVQHTGGGVMAIYAGPQRVDEDGNTRWAALCGPGFLDDGTLLLDANEIYVGPDDQGEADPVSVHDLCVPTVERVVAVIAAQVRLDDPTQSVTEDAARALLA